MLMLHLKHFVIIVGSTVRSSKENGELQLLVLSVAHSSVTCLTSNKLLLVPSRTVKLVVQCFEILV